MNQGANKWRVKLEPELAELAVDWDEARRFQVARKLERWAHQLRLSSRIAIKDRFQATSPPRLRRARLRILVSN